MTAPLQRHVSASVQLEAEEIDALVQAGWRQSDAAPKHSPRELQPDPKVQLRLKPDVAGSWPLFGLDAGGDVPLVPPLENAWRLTVKPHGCVKNRMPKLTQKEQRKLMH